MPTIGTNDIAFFLSGGTGNSNPNLSLGGSPSNTPVSGVLNSLFSDVTSEQASNGLVDYRCFYVYNESETAYLYNATAYIQSQTNSGSTVQIGVSVNPIDTVAPLIPTENTPPTGVYFFDSGPSNKITLGTLGPGQKVPVWLKRTTPAGTDFKESDSFVLKISGKPFLNSSSSS